MNQEPVDRTWTLKTGGGTAGGWRCERCGIWVEGNDVHFCPVFPYFSHVVKVVGNEMVWEPSDTDKLAEATAKLSEAVESLGKRIELLENALLPCITDVVGLCASCGWKGAVREMEPDVDGEGSLGCPRCGNIIIVKG
jgi:DNA-directed RNA polymerase subunit RPC12/RpoP